MHSTESRSPALLYTSQNFSRRGLRQKTTSAPHLSDSIIRRHHCSDTHLGTVTYFLRLKVAPLQVNTLPEYLKVHMPCMPGCGVTWGRCLMCSHFVFQMLVHTYMYLSTQIALRIFGLDSLLIQSISDRLEPRTRLAEADSWHACLSNPNLPLCQMIYLNPLGDLKPSCVSSLGVSLKILSSFLFSLQREKLNPAETTATNRQNAVEIQEPFV